jgi:hypothetical protein
LTSNAPKTDDQYIDNKKNSGKNRPPIGWLFDEEWGTINWPESHEKNSGKKRAPIGTNK